MKAILKRLPEKSSYRIIRARLSNQFFAQQETLALLSKHSYLLQRIVYGGAHVVDFARMMRSVFADAVIDLVDPRTACRAACCTR